LVLSRKRGQTVHIGQDITVTLLGVRGQVMKIGIDAPRSLHILRGELRGEERLASAPGAIVLP
jgi:carbon storage regulator